jgi:prepilin peptidase CpaA
MAAIGCLTGPQKALQIVLTAAIAGGILAIVYAVSHRRLRATLANVGELLRFHATFKGAVHPTLNLSNAEAVRMPYAVPIAVGVAYTIWFGLH